MNNDWLMAIIIWIVSGVVSAVIAQYKNRNTVTWFILGRRAAQALPKAPAGSRDNSAKAAIAPSACHSLPWWRPEPRRGFRYPVPGVSRRWFSSSRHPKPPRKRGPRMGANDKISNKLDDMAGKAKEGLGKTTGDKDTENEGKLDQAKSSLKDAGEKVKDAFKN
jgi:uncharacterized protein YjbJ (UPF0337 family)